MKSLGKAILTFAIFGLMAMLVSLLNPGRVEATNPQSVIVNNVPLPVQGTISVGNTPSVNVANTPTVNLSNTTLSVANAVDASNVPIPLVVTQTAPQPFQDECVIVALNNSCNFQAPPTGMRIVIQEFDYEVAVANVGTSLVTLQTTLNSSLQSHNFLSAPDNTNIYLVLHQPTTLYHDDSSAGPVCSVPELHTSGGVTCQISGYFVPSH